MRFQIYSFKLIIYLFECFNSNMDFDKEVAPQFQCEFNIKVPNAAKNGEVVEFFVETLKVSYQNLDLRKIDSQNKLTNALYLLITNKQFH